VIAGQNPESVAAARPLAIRPASPRGPGVAPAR
jgi:hypothetical protein